MAQENHCPQCGEEMPPDAPEGLCPKCLMKAVRVSNGDATLEESHLIEGPGTKIGRYELLSLIGEGGMGLVYLAEQKEPVKRRVALKIVKPGMDSAQVIARFEAERQALALLDHPNIAHVFDAGTTETGRLYFVMEYVKGMSITIYCDDRKLNIEQRLRLFEYICEGIHHAHQKGIIHRDIKPSNILVSVHGDRAVPKIIDFGIAKATARSLTDKTVFTSQGQLLGTPEYMSPEQVDLATQDIDTRSDIYSLGVLLYELLAGVLPFEEESLRSGGFAEIQRTIREQEPATPSTRLTNLGDQAKEIARSRKTQVIALARCLHRELEWIPLKAMRKDRCRRYRSASEMADDIQNYLNGSPLIAGPETAVYRARKFIHKHAGSVVTVALVAVAIVLGLIVSTAMYLRSEKALEKEAIARVQAEDAEEVAREQRKLAEERAEELRHTVYANSIQLADARYRDADIYQVRGLLDNCPNDLRGWEWNRLDHISDQSNIVFTHQKGVTSLVLSPDGRQIFTGGWGQNINVWDTSSGAKLMTIPTGNGYWITHIVLSPDGKQIVSGDDTGQISIWDTATGTREITLKAHNGWIPSIAYSPDGRHIVSGSNDDIGSVKVWDVTDGTKVMTVTAHDERGIGSVAFSPDGKKIASAGNGDGAIKVWDVSNGHELISFAGSFPVSFTPAGQLVASGGYNDINLWDVTTGSRIMSLRGHNGAINSISISPDGKYVVSGSNDNTVKLWDISTGEMLMTLRGHEAWVFTTAFTPDGKKIVSGSWDGIIRIWDATVNKEFTRLVGHNSNANSVAYSPDSKQVVSSSTRGTVKLWNVESGTEVMTLHHGADRREYYSVAFSPDGKRVASGGSWHGSFKIWDTATGVETLTVSGHDDNVIAVSFSPDGRYIASGSYDKRVKVWDAVNGKELIELRGHESRVLCVAFSPDGRFIASGSFDPNIIVWDWPTGNESLTLQGHPGMVNSVAFSPDGKRIISSSGDNTVRVWAATTGTELMTLKHKDYVMSAAFSPDGRRIISGCRDRRIRVWDAVTGAEMLTLRAGSSVGGVAFSPDGRTIACGAKTILLWESAEPVNGYEARKTGIAARKLVDELHEEQGLYSKVIDKLKADDQLNESVRKIAVQIANSRKCEDAEMLNK